MKRPQGTPFTVSPVDFCEDHVFPAVFDHLDRVFPELGLVRKGRGWTATNAETTKARFFGARPDRVVCNRPGGFLVYGGTVCSWLAYHRGGETPRGADFVEAVKELAALAGVDTSPLERELTPWEAGELEARERRQDLLEDFVTLTRETLMGGTARAHARAYLVDRGFAEDELGGLPLGFYVGKGTVAARLGNRGYTETELAASGVLADGRWEGRLVIPWRDAGGRVATVAARDLTGTTGAGDKYLYLKGATKPPAFGLDKAARTEGLVLVEGLLDVVLLNARGVENVAALGGAGDLLTAERWEKLAALGFPSFTLALDADEAGRAGTVKALENLRKVDNVRKVYVITEGALGAAKDPDELVRTVGLEAFREAVAKARPWALHQGDRLLQGVTPESEERAKREAVDRVLSLSSSLRGDVAALDAEDLLHLAAERTGYTFETLAEMDLSRRERRELERAEAELRDAARALEADLGKPGADPRALAAVYSKRLSVVQGRTDDTPPPFNVDGLLRELANTSEGLASGWAALDALGVRFRPKELAVLGARTGHGKTSALVNLLRAWLDPKRSKVDGALVFFSHEEPSELVLCRLLALVEDEQKADFGLSTLPDPNEVWALTHRWPFSEVRDYCRSPLSRGKDYGWPDPKMLDHAKDYLRAAEDRLVIVHRPTWSASRVAAYAHELAETRGVGAVLVDYLQRLPSEGKADRRDIEVSATGRTLKALAVGLSVPVVVGAQINREAIPQGYQEKVRAKLENGTEAALEYMKAARPDLHNLREGGSEQEADLVLGLMNYAADLRTEDGEDHKTNRFEVGVLKNRYGVVGQWARLAFEGRFGLVRSCTKDER